MLAVVGPCAEAVAGLWLGVGAALASACACGFAGSLGFVSFAGEAGFVGGAGAGFAVAVDVLFFVGSDARAFVAVHTTPITTVASSDDARMKLSDLRDE